jgi:hypothetical protein
MKNYMLDEGHIRNVINSRNNLGAYGPDGISNQIIQGAGQEGVRFIQILIRASILNRKTIASWKDAQTVLLYKK